MGRRRKSGMQEFWDGFNQSYSTVNRVMADKETRDIANAKQEESTAFTEDQGQQLSAAADSGQYDVTFNQTTGQYEVTPKAGGETGTFAPKTETKFLGKTYGQKLTPGQENSARMQAMSGVMGKFGDPMGAARLRAAAGDLEQTEQKRADDAELRRVLSTRDQSQLRSSVGSGADLGGASDVNGYTETNQEVRAANARQQPTGQQPGGRQPDPLHDYLTRVGPRALETMVKQGRLTEAKAFSDFMDTEQGQNYATRWLTGVRKHAIGDSTGALQEFERLYNEQLYNDGRTVRMTPLEDGKRYRLEQLDADGKAVSTKEGEISALADNAAAALSPTAAAAFHVKQQAERAKEGAQLDRQIQLEKLRQEGRETAEDRRDARLVQTLEARDRQRSAGGGLTLAQQRSNAEIDAAREAVAGMSPDEIRKRTAKTTDTGRENPDYDPGLARAAALANRRKVGDDADFDQRTQGQKQPQQAPAIDRKDVAGRFRSDRSMDQYRLGRDTPQGVEVLDKQGRVIGHYR